MRLIIEVLVMGIAAVAEQWQPCERAKELLKCM